MSVQSKWKSCQRSQEKKEKETFPVTPFFSVWLSFKKNKKTKCHINRYDLQSGAAFSKPHGLLYGNRWMAHWWPGELASPFFLERSSNKPPADNTCYHAMLICLKMVQMQKTNKILKKEIKKWYSLPKVFFFQYLCWPCWFTGENVTLTLTCLFQFSE